MINKKQLIVFIGSIIIIAIFVMAGLNKTKQENIVVDNTQQIEDFAKEIEKVSINEESEFWQIKAFYPKVNSPALTETFKLYVENQISQFKEDTSWVKDGIATQNTALTLDIDYKNISSTNFQNYVFSNSFYTGGAHGMHIRKTFNYNKKGELITLTKIFNNEVEGLQKLSSLVQKELLKRDGAQKDWIMDGAGAKEENYQSFIINDDGITILFDQYQVAPYSDGQIDIYIPFENIKDFIKKDIFSL